MKRLIPISLILLAGVTLFCNPARAERQEIDLSGQGWSLWQDTTAQWKNDELFLPPVDLSKVPTNPPSCGWEQLKPDKGLAVAVPGTAEEYLSDGTGPKSAVLGVTWWYRTLHVPKYSGPQRVMLQFDSVRLRSEVYLNGKLVGYNLVENAPFEVDITDQVKPGQDAQLAVRVTNPGGNYMWADFLTLEWGKYKLPMSHGFGGITGGVKLVVCNPVYIDDIYMQNTPELRHANAIVTIRNTTSEAAKRNLLVRVVEKKNPSKEIFSEEVKEVSLPAGDTIKSVKVAIPKAKLWDLDHPELYVCQVSLKEGKKSADSAKQTFGFRWFAPEGIGQNALLRLNGKRIVLCTAISWGFWPINGIYPTPEWTEKQIRDAKDFGMNMLNFHRCIGSPIVMDKADELGLLYYEEPGGYAANGKDSFSRALSREKLLRMVKRDRSHPCMVIYNMINEQVGELKDDALFGAYLRDIKDAHAVDPSRTITLASSWAKSFDKEERVKLHMRPFDEKPYQLGWWDAHRASGPVSWKEGFYADPKHSYGYTENTGEIVYHGEEGAMSAPPRLALIKKELDTAPHKGWDGGVYLEWYDAFADFLKRKDLAKAFSTVDDLCTAMGTISLEHQGRKIEDHRVCDANDGYAINGWEAEIVENHSGIVDCFRNPKADPAILAYYNQPLYVAVKTRNQVVNAGNSITVDFFAINEKDLKGAHTLEIKMLDPKGQEVFSKKAPVTLTGGDVYGQLLVEGVSIPTPPTAGMCRIEARLVDSADKEKASGHDQIFTVDWKSAKISGKGAVLENGDKVGGFLKSQKNVDVPAFEDKQGPLDWIVVARPLKGKPVAIASEFLRDLTGQKKGLTATFFSGRDFNEQLGQRVTEKVDFNWSGSPPDPSVKQIENYSVRWEGTLLPPTDGEYLFNIFSDDGVRLWVDGKQIMDNWKTGRLTTEAKTMLAAGKPVSIRLEYFQGTQGAEVHLKWAPPAPLSFDPARLFERAKQDGTTLLLLDGADTWMDQIKQYCPIKYSGQFEIGKDWLGGQYFVREHPLFKDMPVNVGLNWQYQCLLGGERLGLNLDGEEMVVGCYNSWPFHLGTAVAVIPCGKGRVIISTLNLCENLSEKTGPTEVARKLLCNFLEFSEKH